jgi:hypothetical protein
VEFFRMGIPRTALVLLVAPTVLLLAWLTIVRPAAVQAANSNERLQRWSQFAIEEDCDPSSVLLSTDDVPDGLLLEREEDFWIFESSLRRTFRGTLPQRDPQSSTELGIQVVKLPSDEEAEEYMQGIRAVLDLLERSYVQWTGLVGEETIVVRESEEVAGEPARDRIDVHFQAGQFIGSVFWEDDAGWSSLDTILDLARTMETQVIACGSVS